MCMLYMWKERKISINCISLQISVNALAHRMHFPLNHRTKKREEFRQMANSSEEEYNITEFNFFQLGKKVSGTRIEPRTFQCSFNLATWDDKQATLYKLSAIAFVRICRQHKRTRHRYKNSIKRCKSRYRYAIIEWQTKMLLPKDCLSELFRPIVISGSSL